MQMSPQQQQQPQKRGMSTGGKLTLVISGVSAALCATGVIMSTIWPIGDFVATGDGGDDGVPETRAGRIMLVEGVNGAANITVSEIESIQGACVDWAEPTSGAYRVFTIEVEATSGQFSVNPLYVSLTDSDGYVHEYAPECSGDMPVSALSTREKASATLAYDTTTGGGYVTVTDELLRTIGRWEAP